MGDRSPGWAAPGTQGRGTQRGGQRCWAEQGHLAASRGWCCLTLEPPKAPPSSLGALEAGFCVLSPSGDLEPPEELPRPERLQQPQPQPQQPSGAEACPQLMLSLAPRNAAKVKDLICVLVKEICSQLYISPPPPCTSWRASASLPTEEPWQVLSPRLGQG